MKDLKADEKKDLAEKPEKSSPKMKSERMVDSVRGTSLESDPWKHEDGTRFHTICQQEVDDKIADVDNDINVTNNQQVTLRDQKGDPKVGIIDTLIEHKGKSTVIDYKTDDMSSWTIAKAARIGEEYGAKLEEYINSEDSASGTKGYVIAVGRHSKSSDVMDAYVRAVRSHSIEVLFSPGGEPEDVVSTVRQAMSQTEESEPDM